MLHDPLLYRHIVLALWCVWGVWWLASAARTKLTRRRESLGSRLAHVLPLTLGGALLAWHVPWAPLAQRLWSQSLPAYGAGVMLLAAGLAFAIWARVHLGRNWSGTVTVKEEHELIRSGPYAYVRHPIYTGVLAAALGTAIASGTVCAAGGVAVIAAALMRKIRIEERFLGETFPAEYPRYRAEVPALIPYTRARRSAPR